MREEYLAGYCLQFFKVMRLDRLQPKVLPSAPFSAWWKSIAGANCAVLRGDAAGRAPAQCITYSAPTSACGKGRMPVWAVQRFDEMRQEVPQLEVITCTALLSACGKGGKPECAVQHFDEMRQEEL